MKVRGYCWFPKPTILYKWRYMVIVDFLNQQYRTSEDTWLLLISQPPNIVQVKIRVFFWFPKPTILYKWRYVFLVDFLNPHYCTSEDTCLLLIGRWEQAVNKSHECFILKINHGEQTCSAILHVLYNNTNMLQHLWNSYKQTTVLTEHITVLFIR